MSDKHDQKPLSPKEAAVALGIHPDTMRDYLRRGLVPGWKATSGGRWLVPVEAVERIRSGEAPLPVQGPELS